MVDRATVFLGENFDVGLRAEEHEHPFFVEQSLIQCLNEAVQRPPCDDGLHWNEMHSDLRTVGRGPDLSEVFGLDAERFDEDVQTVRRHCGGQEVDLHIHLAELFGESFPFAGAIGMAIDDVVKFVDKDFAELLP